MAKGWLKLHRKIKKWEWYGDPLMVALFVHLIIEANYESKMWRGREIKRGQFITSGRKLASETGLSYQTIRTKLKQLQLTQELTQEPTQKYTIITLCNYESYQPTDEEINAIANAKTPHDLDRDLDRDLDSTKEVKKLRSKENNKYSPFFDEIWDQYPRKEGRKEAERHFNTSVKTDDDLENIRTAVKNYSESVIDKEYQYIKMGKTFFNNWRDYIRKENFTPKESEFNPFEVT